MKVLKTLVFVILGLVALFLLVAAFLPKEAHIERSIVIEQPADTVFDALLDYHVYKQWNPWSKKEPGSSHEIIGTPGTIGHKWTWEGDTIGKGSLEIKEFERPVIIYSDLTFIEPNTMTAKDIWKLEEAPNGTKITWINESDLNYPVGRFFGLFLDQMLAPDFEQGLNDLKVLLEKNT